MTGDQKKEAALQTSYEVPKKLSLDELRGYAKERAQAAEQQMEQGHDRAGLEM
jgi:hypothetical protein